MSSYIPIFHPTKHIILPSAKDPGFGWRLARGIVAGAIQFTVLESTKDALESSRK